MFRYTGDVKVGDAKKWVMPEGKLMIERERARWRRRRILGKPKIDKEPDRKQALYSIILGVTGVLLKIEEI